MIKDLRKKMVFLGGPRQCGKSTLAESILKDFPYPDEKKGLLLNWDDDVHRRQILKRLWTEEENLIVFDELHKFQRWKNWLKGVYDTTKQRHRYLVTGSARLDVYRRGGDSLFGRYFYWRLHPFTLSEEVKGISKDEMFKRLLTVGGFPEPFLDGNEQEAKRWRKQRFERVVRDDIRDLEHLKDIQTLLLFLDALRERVGSPLVLSNLAEDLQVSQKTLNRWLAVLERMYIIFIVRPWTRNLPRAIQKPPKVYFFDNGDVLGSEGARFENLVGTHLLKKIHFLEDSTGDRFELCYIRDKEGREVDFVVVKDKIPTELIECKVSEAAPHKPLIYFAEKLKPQKALQMVAHINKSYDKGKLQVRGPLDALVERLG